MENSLCINANTDIDCVLILFTGKKAIETFWELTCPCGVIVTYPLNKLPEVDTLHPCDNPKHWTIKYEEESEVLNGTN